MITTPPTFKVNPVLMMIVKAGIMDYGSFKIWNGIKLDYGCLVIIIISSMAVISNIDLLMRRLVSSILRIWLMDSLSS